MSSLGFFHGLVNVGVVLWWDESYLPLNNWMFEVELWYKYLICITGVLTNQNAAWNNSLVEAGYRRIEL